MIGDETALQPHLNLLCHPDILPLILSFSDDRALANLMRVNRYILSEIVRILWPQTAIDLVERRPPIQSRTTLPSRTVYFSSGMERLIACYSRIVHIPSHAKYRCPPRLIWGGQSPLADTIVVSAKGLCRTTDLIQPSKQVLIPPHPPRTTQLDSFLQPEVCDICRLYTPQTLVINNISQHPRFPIPSGLHLASTLTRLVLDIQLIPVNYSSWREYGSVEPYMHEVIPDHIVDIVFVLTRSTYRLLEVLKNPINHINIAEFCEAVSLWMLGSVTNNSSRQWTVVGAELLGGYGKSEVEGELREKLHVPTEIRRGVSDAIAKSGMEMEVLDRFQLISMAAYLNSPEARSELSSQELLDARSCAAMRREKVRKSHRMGKKLGT